MNLKTPKEIALEIASRVRAHRCDRKLTQKAFSAQCGIKYGTYRHFEQTGSISFTALIQIAQQLDLDSELDQLFQPRVFASLDEIENESLASPVKRRAST